MIARARALADDLASRWPDERTAEMSAAFERATVDALRAPVLAERSIVLRKIAKRLLPRSARPVARRAVAVVDGISRRVVDAIASRR